MALRYLPVCCFVLLLTLQAMESFALQMSRQEMTHTPLLDRHLVDFIRLLCEHQKGFPVRLTRKFCSTKTHLHRRQEGKGEDEQQQEQREKRVGWTISV